MLRVVRIKSYERGLLFRHGDFVRLLEPGKYWFWSPLLRRRPWDVQIASTLKTRFEHELLDVLVRHADLARALTVVELADHQRALVWRDGRLACMLGPGRYAFWKEPYALAIEVFDSNQLRFEHEKLRAITAFPGAAQYLHVVDVADYEAALLLKDGQIVDRLAPGRHVFWAQNGRVTHKTVDCREQMLDVAGQEIMTGDKVTLRLTSDRSLVLHLHGYDIEKPVAAGAVTELAFTAYATGRFPIEIHAPGAGAGSVAHQDAPLAIIEVYPR